jgi:hypothetical protein
VQQPRELGKLKHLIPEPEMINPVAGYWKQHVAKALSLTLKK